MTTAQRRRARVRAPELVGRDWLNTGGQGIRLAETTREDLSART
ncbi:hypothetical protein [Saccharothrix syringae]|nr:hypothetical protein [Saccharothrix syringae]